MHICARIFAWAWDFLVGSTAYPMQHTVGIEVRVTNEIPVSVTEENTIRDVAPPWMASPAPSRTTPATPTHPHPQYLSPHVFQGRNSLCCANDYTLRRRRPMTLRIGPRLSLPNKSTSAPTTTTDGEWPAIR
ncbi:hypothetical protein HZH66_007137 [Vespula vulgaris]|uniref:Secreted protein n=2 Tax=Vespula vulgaris TaxID=7454 RepID=A0A834N5A3_VESVU|nr:uncharacterized protein LOC127065392 isoform X2 [Vespula vulgaris]XP_050853631.1 uncharacterized protein LOC127065392 isoform X3 [Vespula vulgaris]KAF7396275.1 hypothetical protein HZH66_007137 [Vespula vulgaris]